MKPRHLFDCVGVGMTLKLLEANYRYPTSTNGSYLTAVAVCQPRKLPNLNFIDPASCGGASRVLRRLLRTYRSTTSSLDPRTQSPAIRVWVVLGTTSSPTVSRRYLGFLPKTLAVANDTNISMG